MLLVGNRHTLFGPDGPTDRQIRYPVTFRGSDPTWWMRRVISSEQGILRFIKISAH